MRPTCLLVRPLHALRWCIAAIGLCGTWAVAQDGFDVAKPVARFALVVVNPTYPSLGDLPSAAEDGVRAARRLKDLGFDVTVVPSLASVRVFEEEVLPNFRKKINEGDLVVFYFSGHGFSYGQGNFIAPSDLAPPVAPEYLTRRAIALESVEDYLSKPQPGLLLMVVDACRSIAGFVVSSGGQPSLLPKGMSLPPQPTGAVSSTVIAFAARPGTVALASSKSGELSAFTAGLLTHIATEGVEFEQMFRDVSTDVVFATGQGQQPGLFNWSTSDLFLKPSATIQSQEREVWLAALSTGRPMEVQRYLLRHAVSPYADAARKWLAQPPTTAVPYSNVSPVAVDRAWNDPSSAKAVLRASPGFAYRTRESEISTMNFTNPALGIVGGEQPSPLSTSRSAQLSEQLDRYTAHGTVVVSSAMLARSSPSIGSAAIATVEAGTPIKIDDVVRRSADGSAWISGKLPGLDRSIFLSVPAAPAQATLLGRNLLEVVAQPLQSGLPDLVNAATVQSALAELRLQKRVIRRVSLAAASSTKEKERLIRSAQLTYVGYLLRQGGVDASLITSVSNAEDLKGDGVRIRFFGE